MLNKMKKGQCILCLSCLSLLQACTTIPNPDTSDPWEGMNRDIFVMNDTVDRNILKPIAKGYQWITPQFVDTGITNFFSNLSDVGVSINDFLQAKPKQGMMDTTRFLINSTVGIAGFVDIASLIKLPKHEEDFAQTLAVWGVPRGPYFVMPFYGPSSIRGVSGFIGDTLLHPLTYTFLFANSGVSWGGAGLRAVNLIDARADFLGAEAVASEAAMDRYIFFRSAYIQRRDYLIHDGEIQPLELEDLDEEDLDDDLYESLE